MSERGVNGQSHRTFNDVPQAFKLLYESAAKLFPTSWEPQWKHSRKHRRADSAASTRSGRRDRCLVNAHFNSNEPRTAPRKHKVREWVKKTESDPRRGGTRRSRLCGRCSQREVASPSQHQWAQSEGIHRPKPSAPGKSAANASAMGSMPAQQADDEAATCAFEPPAAVANKLKNRFQQETEKLSERHPHETA